MVSKSRPAPQPAPAEPNAVEADSLPTPEERRLRAELGGLKLRALVARAEAVGVDEEKLEQAEEKPELIDLILARLRPRVELADDGRHTVLREELGGMKLTALTQRAEEVGVGAAAESL